MVFNKPCNRNKFDDDFCAPTLVIDINGNQSKEIHVQGTDTPINHI